MIKKRNEPKKDTGVMFNNEAKEKSYKRHKYRCYCGLIIKSLLAFILGLFIAALLKL